MSFTAMTSDSDQDWRLIIGCPHELLNDASSRKTINQATQAIHRHLAAAEASLLKTQEVSDLSGCLRVVLQFWSKGVQSPSNPWSQSCIDLTSVLTEALTRPGTSVEMLSKCSKLIGFTLVRSALMGEVGEILFCANKFSDIALATCTLTVILLMFDDDWTYRGERSCLFLPVLVP
jgi:hypothetical protein